MTFPFEHIQDFLFLAQENFLSAKQEAELNTLQLWFITGASLMLVALVLWQILANNRRARLERTIKQTQEDAIKILEHSREQASTEAEAIRKEALIQAKETAISLRDAEMAKLEGFRQEILKSKERLDAREDAFAERFADYQRRVAELDSRDEAGKAERQRLEEEQEELDRERQRNSSELQRISGLSAEDARAELMEAMRNSLVGEQAAMLKRMQDETTEELRSRGRQVMLTAMERYAGEEVASAATSIVSLPSEEMKGRIIGRDGRNIRALEAATGTNILVDETPQSVVVSCFDPIRRMVAKRVLEKLIQDGRIHPSRVEELVEATRAEFEEELQKAGQAAAERFQILLPPQIHKLLGILKYRTSFSQSVLAHSIEVASLAGAIAAELGLDQSLAQRAGLLHDIGKAVDHERKGTHAALGADILKRAGEDPAVVNAVSAHHDEVDKTGPYAVLVQICDTISAARPGARSESTEFFVQRLENLERIGNSFPGVECCYATQAGRELRVVVKPSQVSEEEATILAHDLARKIEAEMRYPGQIRVSVLRETRATEYAL